MTNEQLDFIKKNIRYHYLVSLFRFLVFILILALWELTTQLKIINPFIFSSPSRIINTFIKMTQNGQIFYHIGITLLETLISFALVVIIGLLAAIILWMFKMLTDIIEPYLVMLNSLPKSALAPLLIVWIGNNQKTIIVTAVSVAVFGTIISIYTAFSEADAEKIKLIRTLGGSKTDILFKLILPSSMPIIISTMKVNVGLCLVGVIIGEFLAAKAGLGYLIIYGSQVFKLDWVLMGIVILCIIAIILYRIINSFEKWYCKRI